MIIEVFIRFDERGPILSAIRNDGMEQKTQGFIILGFLSIFPPLLTLIFKSFLGLNDPGCLFKNLRRRIFPLSIFKDRFF
jgi:hypothetical protein